MKTLYVSDLDGTLLRSDVSTSDYTNRTINRLARQGMLFSYATARSYSTSAKVTRGLDAHIPLIVYNGVEDGIERVSRFMMPFIALLSTILIGWIKTPDYVIGEMERNGEHFRRKSVYRVMIRYIAPVMMLILFLQSTGILS